MGVVGVVVVLGVVDQDGACRPFSPNLLLLKTWKEGFANKELRGLKGDCPAALIWSSGRVPWGAFPGLNGQARIYTGGHSRIYRGSPLIYLKAFHNICLRG